MTSRSGPRRGSLPGTEQLATTARRHTIAEYFRLSAETDPRLEYFEGVVVAMPGASPAHSQIGSNVNGELRARLTGTPRTTHDASLQVRLGRRPFYRHPDVTVVCGPLDRDPTGTSGNAILNPTLVVEVFGPSTEKYDRTLKFERYRDVASLQEYVLVEQDEPTVVTDHRNDGGTRTFGPNARRMDATIHLRLVDLDLPLSEVCARVTFPPPRSRSELTADDDGK